MMPRQIGEKAFLRMIQSGSEAAVAWDRDVDQQSIKAAPRLYLFRKNGMDNPRVYVDKPGSRPSLICWEFNCEQGAWHPMFRNYNAMRTWQAKYSRNVGDHVASILEDVQALSEYSQSNDQINGA